MSDKSTLILTTLVIMFWSYHQFDPLIWDISLSIGSYTFPGWTGSLFFFWLGLLSIWSFKALGDLYLPSSKNPSDL